MEARRSISPKYKPLTEKEKLLAAMKSFECDIKIAKSKVDKISKLLDGLHDEASSLRWKVKKLFEKEEDSESSDEGSGSEKSSPESGRNWSGGEKLPRKKRKIHKSARSSPKKKNK